MRITVKYNDQREIMPHLNKIEAFSKDASKNKSLKEMKSIIECFVSFIELNKQELTKEKIADYLSHQEELNEYIPERRSNDYPRSLLNFFKDNKNDLFVLLHKINLCVKETEVIFVLNDDICCGMVSSLLPNEYIGSKCGDILEPLGSIVQYESYPTDSVSIYRQMIENLKEHISEDIKLVSRIKSLGFETIDLFLSSKSIEKNIKLEDR